VERQVPAAAVAAVAPRIKRVVPQVTTAVAAAVVVSPQVMAVRVRRARL